MEKLYKSCLLTLWCRQTRLTKSCQRSSWSAPSTRLVAHSMKLMVERGYQNHLVCSLTIFASHLTLCVGRRLEAGCFTPVAILRLESQIFGNKWVSRCCEIRTSRFSELCAAYLLFLSHRQQTQTLPSGCV
jgi:hypothetical protein